MSEKNILIIDDNEDILYTLEEICKYQGWKALKATGYEEAKVYFSSRHIDLIIIDYHMPELDGVTVVKEIRKNFDKIPIIVLTVEERDSIVEKFMAAGASDYALKPIKAVDLISRIKVHLQYHEKIRFYEDYEKGISKVTLQKIESYLGTAESFVSAEDIEKYTEIKLKTVYRYMTYMVKSGKVNTEYSYQDSGRPKITYKLKT